jgi:hypothetical protein
LAQLLSPSITAHRMMHRRITMASANYRTAESLLINRLKECEY